MDPLVALLSERPPQQLYVTELRARIALLEDAARAYRAELESRTAWLDALPEEMDEGEQDAPAAATHGSAAWAGRQPGLRAVRSRRLHPARRAARHRCGTSHPWLPLSPARRASRQWAGGGGGEGRKPPCTRVEARPVLWSELQRGGVMHRVNEGHCVGRLRGVCSQGHMKKRKELRNEKELWVASLGKGQSS